MDQPLARRLERTEGTIGTSFTAVRRRLAPEVGSAWHDFDGTYAMFDGPDSLFTQTFGLGLFAPVTADSLAAIEAYFGDRGAKPTHEVSSLAGIGVHGLLADRGYRPVDLSSVLVQELAAPSTPPATALRARRIDEADHPMWIETSLAGWSDDPAVAHMLRAIVDSAVQNPSMIHFIVERDGAAIATASMGIHEGVALLAGACTIPSGRGLGAQGLLLTARLDEARRRDCDVAMMASTPGSTSQRNAERRGFRVAYTRTKWQRASITPTSATAPA